MDFRERLSDFLERPAIRRGIIGVIVLNALILGLETSGRAMAAAGEGQGGAQ